MKVKTAQRIWAAVPEAESAFWAEIAKAFPEAKTGDLDPMYVMQLRDTMRAAVERWVELNVED